MKKAISSIIMLLIVTTTIQSQEALKNVLLDIKLPSSVLVNGTSTLHDWQSKVEKTDAKIEINNYYNIAIETLEVKIEATSIKSGKKLMDKLTYKALKAEEYPVITFIFKKGEIISENTDSINIKLKGDLTIAGTTKNVAVLTTINKLGNEITLIGKHKLKMTDFGIKPPTALLGTIKTGNEITIEFNLKF